VLSYSVSILLWHYLSLVHFSTQNLCVIYIGEFCYINLFDYKFRLNYCFYVSRWNQRSNESCLFMTISFHYQEIAKDILLLLAQKIV